MQQSLQKIYSGKTIAHDDSKQKIANFKSISRQYDLANSYNSMIGEMYGSIDSDLTQASTGMLLFGITPDDDDDLINQADIYWKRNGEYYGRQ